jgi:NAD(P)-dependent dehydrogenase (short-subunit alcohol dehydrogenase family)
VVDELADKVVIVTGGASGIGRGIVEKFVSEGARVVIADVERDSGADLAAKLGADAHFQLTDVAEPEQVGALVEVAVEKYGGLHVMVNNAGISGTMHRRFFDDELADFHRVMAVNVLGVMAGTRDAARQMATGGGGSIINLTSIGGIQAGGGRSGGCRSGRTVRAGDTRKNASRPAAEAGGRARRCSRGCAVLRR